MAKNKITSEEIASEAALDQISGGGISKRTLAEILGSVAAVGTVAGIIVGAAFMMNKKLKKIDNAMNSAGIFMTSTGSIAMLEGATVDPHAKIIDGKFARYPHAPAATRLVASSVVEEDQS